MTNDEDTDPRMAEAVQVLILHPNISLPYHLNGCKFTIKVSKNCSWQQSICHCASILKLSTPLSQPQEQLVIELSEAIASLGDMSAALPQDADEAPVLTIKPKKT